MISLSSLKNREAAVAVVGLGYVGLPLSVALAPHFEVIGFDIRANRIEELKRADDVTLEVSVEKLQAVKIEFTTDPEALKRARVIILAIPTPVREGNVPDLTLVEKATALVGKYLQKDSIVVYESTVYPGATEEVCIPILERESGLKMGADFTIGYSPERINPGDKEHTIDKITKVVAGSDAATLEVLTGVYGSFTQIFKATSIKVAEAAKVIENTQRDLNIALMNELTIIFERMGISIYDVLAAAGTKWNFLKFTPGLVGGHCIGVDPYYLTFKSEALGYRPEVILAGRRINDGMGRWIITEIMKRISRLGHCPGTLKVSILGMTFKENVPDVRNSKVADLYHELRSYGLEPIVYDPLADAAEVKHEYGIDLAPQDALAGSEVVIVAVPHKRIKDQWPELKKLFAGAAFVADIKHTLTPEDMAGLKAQYWTL